MNRNIENLAARWVAAQNAGSSRTDSAWQDIFTVQDLKADPERLWLFVLMAEPLARGTEAFGLLAAGPLEDLIQDHGPAFIERIEQEAHRNAGFAELLTGVWVPDGNDPVTLRYLALGCDRVRPSA